MVNIIIYLKKEHCAKELVRHLFEEKLIASATIDENNISYTLENSILIGEVFSIITAQSKSFLFNEIVNAVESTIGEEASIISTPIVASNKIYDDSAITNTMPI